MKKKFVRLISAVLSAAMTLTAVPLSAFAEGEGHTHDGESNVITTPLDFREKTADESGDGWNWDYDTKTLTLNGVNIQATTDSMSVVTVPDGTEIVLNGNNTIVQTDTGKSDTYVLSAVNNKEVNCDGTMTISGDGVLNAENRSTDSMARSLGGSIILNGGTVNATGTVKTNSLEIHNDGVLNANATTASFEGVAVNVSGGITVDGNGSLTAVGCANESTLNSAILLTGNSGDKISVSGNGSITVPESNKARVGIYYSGNNGDGMDAEIRGGKVTAYGTKYGIYKVNLIMNGTGSVYTTGGSYAIGQTVPTIDENEFVIKGSTEFKASESAVTGEVKYNSGYYEIGGADAKTVVIKPDTSPRIILGKQTGIFKTEEYEIIEGMTDTKLKGTVYFDITLKNMSDEEFADARGYFGGDEPDLSASIIKTDYGWVCMVCDTEFSVTYDTDNTLTIKCGDIVSNTVQVKSNANRFNKVTQGDNTNRTVFYTNTSQEEKDNYKLVSTYTVDSESISYNWYSTNSAYSADELGAAVSGSNGEFKLADNIPAGNYVLYCDITYSDGDSTETVTEKFTFTYKECAHENGYSDGKCTNCGALCDHSNIDINTGKCNKCEHQFVATISTDGNAPTGYDTLTDCLDSITADTGNYVKIYQDIGDTSATATLDTIDVNHNVMVDLNGHKLNNIKLGVNKLGVNKDVTLTLTGTEGSYVTQVYVRKGGGSFIIDSEANVEFDTIFVEDSARLAVNDGAKVTTEQLTVIASVNDDGTTTTSVKLATGMKLGGLTYHRQNNSGALKLGNLLDVTRQALRREDNGNYLDLYKEYGSMGYSVALTVVEHTDADHKYSDGTGKCEECGKPCEHGGDINTDTGICSICGAVVSVALYTDKNGSLKYVDTDELDSLLNEYNGSGTIKLFKDYSKPSAQYDLYGELTIDLNGRRLNIRSITPCKNGKLTIKNSGNPVMLGCNVYPTNDASYAGGTLIIDGDVVLDTSIYVYDSSTVILKAGAYPAGLYARDSKTLYDMLGEGKAFFKTDGTLFNASVKEISSSETLTVKDHSHTYVDGKCGCGYVCTHSDVDSETGKCNECEYQYAAVIVKDGAVASVYEENEMGAAFEAADSDANTGCTLRVYKNYTGSYTTLSGKFTLWIAEKANVGTLTVSGDITVTGSGKNNRIYGDFNVAAGGKLTFDENCGAMGTVSVGAGTFDCYSTFSITLNINDASSDVILHGGAFKTICYNGGGDRANAEILTLLAENRMFMKSPNPEPIDGSKTLLKDGFATPVIVIPHEGHSYDSTTGKCTICGKRCGHTDVDSKTGVCSTCKYQLTAGISGAGTAKYFDNIDDAFTAALSAENNGCTLTLYKNCEITQNVEIGNTTVTVDVNGCSLGGEADISVNNGGVLYLKDSRKSTYYGCIDAPFSVNGGELTVDMNGFGVYINSFNGSGTQITIRSDSKCTFGVENGFSMDGGTVTFSGEVSVVCQNVKLNATYFSSYVETLKIDTLILEDGVLLKQLASITNANIANIDCSSEIYLYQILASGSRVDSQLYSDLKANASSNFDNVRIIRCDHPDGVGRDNRCIYCNSLIAASVSYTENGAEKTEYFVKEDLGKAFAKANSVAIATITMLMSSAYDTDYLPVTGDVTLIANGDNAILYNTVKVADGGKLTLRGNANIFAVIAEPGSRLTAEEATRIAYLTVNGGDVKLSGGQYDNITVKDGKITDILGNGYAYKKTEGGAWLTLKEREVSEASGVTVAKAPIVQATLSTEMNKLYRNSNANSTLKFNLSLANGSNLNDSYVSKRYGINSYVSGDIIYSSLSALVKDAKLSADEIIDKAGDSDVAEIYFVVTTGDGYEIKSNTVSIDLVDCDHSQVVDPTADKETAGNITEPTYCEICESKFNAKITKGDDVKYYNNLDEAAKDAQKSENEGCTLYPLYNKNGYGGQLVITEGNFTLKYAVRTAFSRPIIINGKAKLTVTGRCAVTAFENQDAFIVQGGDVTFEGLATGSNVTINGGNVTMAANNINCLTINGGNVSISSGGFAEIITNAPNKVIADYIDPGFWVQDRGTKEWIDIYSLNKATASSTNGLTVRLCPMQIIKPIDTVYYTNGYYPGDIPSLQINAEPWYSNEVDAKVAYQWFAIDENGYETVIEGATDRKLSLENLTTGRYYCRLTYSNATTAGVSMASDVVTATITECEHSGGEATCTEKAKCEICGAEYGEPLGHDYVVIKVVEPDYRNEGYSVFECTRCKDSYIGNRVPVKPIPDVEEIAVEKTTYNEVDISWKNISGVDGYYVECYVGNQWKQIGFSTDGDRVAAKLSGLSAGLKYKVRIAAYAGSFTAKFRCFYVDTVPSPVWNINTVKATDETVRISWSRNARADGYKVEWYINNQWSVKTVTGNNNISAVIDGLCAGTRYKVRVSAYKGDLYSPYTYGYIDTLPSKVTGITKTVTSSSFTLKWDKNESADGYTAQYYADGKWNEKTLTGNNKTTVTIGSLKGYKTYKVRIKAYKGELESAFDDIYITTAPTKVSGLKVKSAVDSKAVVIWNADANADGYNVEYYIGGKWVKKTITDNKTAKAVLGGLTPYSTCKVRVRAYKDNLYGDYSYTTVTAVLSPVTNIKVVSAKSNSITVKWGKNASADGYKVEIYKGGKWVKKTLKGSTNATVTIGGLRAGSVYKVRIASYKGANTSTYTYANVKTAK